MLNNNNHNNLTCAFAEQTVSYLYGEANVQEKTKIIRQAVASLPADLRQIVVMKEFEEMTFQEISDALDLPLSTIKSRLYTALKQLRMKLERTPMEIV